MVAGEAVLKSYLRKDVDLMLENILLTINTVVDKWDSLPDSCVNCTIVNVNMFKTYIVSQLEPDT